MRRKARFIEKSLMRSIRLFSGGGGRIRLHFHSPVGNENKGVDAIEPASSDSPPDCRILDLRIRPPAIQTHKKTNPERIGLFVVGEDGFEPSKRNAADLQSVPFGHSGTPPYSIGSDGAGRRTRTPDLLITNQLLYRLSYTGVSNRTRIL